MSQLQPDRQTIADSLLCAAALLLDIEEVPSRAGSEQLRNGKVGLQDLQQLPGLAKAHDRIMQIYDFGVTDLAELSAGVLAAVARETAGWFSHPLGCEISALAGAICAASVLESFGLTLDLGVIEPALQQVQRDPRPTPALVRMLGPLISDTEPRPHVLILTPLAHVPDDIAHARLVEVAAVVRSELEPHAFVVDCPGERLHPDSAHDWSPEHMYDCERRRILQAGGVAVVAADVPSWGLGQSQSWAELNVAAVAVFANNPSRALGSGSQFETVVEPYEDPSSAGQWIAQFMLHRRERLVEHSRENIAVRKAWARQVLPHPSVRSASGTRLGDRRLASITSNPAEAAGMTLMEVRQLRRTHPELADLLCDTVSGRPHSMARGSLEQLAGGTWRSFQHVRHQHQVTATEEYLMVSIATARNPQLAGQRLELGPADWLRILRFIRAE